MDEVPVTTELTNSAHARFPWEPPATADLITALQRDFAYAVANTAIVVHSDNPAFVMVVNTQRGQIVPRGQVRFSDGTTVELQDIGMPQIKVPYLTVQEVMTKIWTIATDLGLELVK